MTIGCTSLVEAQENSSNTMSATHSNRARRNRFGSEGWSNAHRIQQLPDLPLGGGSQMIEIIRDGRRVYITNSLCAEWDEVFYPEGAGAWMAQLDADTSAIGLVPYARFFPHDDDFRGLRAHQTRLQGGDASSDSYCYTS